MSKTPSDPPSRSSLLSPRQAIPQAIPVTDAGDETAGAIPMAIPVSADEVGDIPVALPVGNEPLAEVPEAEADTPPAPAGITCPVCATVSAPGAEYCGDCGSYFSQADLAVTQPTNGDAPPTVDAVAVVATMPTGRIKERYELKSLLSERGGVQRYSAIDHGESGRPVVVIRAPIPMIPDAIPEAEPVAPNEDATDLEPMLDDVMFGDVASDTFPMTDIMPDFPGWPSIAWERRLLHTLESAALPAELDYFADDQYEYLVEEKPAGQLLWDAWDDPDMAWGPKFGYLAELAELLHHLHQCNAMLEGLRPDIVVIDEGRVRLTDLSDLLPLPLPPDTPVRGRLYSAPELTNGMADARADLYGFGAMLYALHVGRELNERTDFDKPGHPKPFIPRFPDCHPAFGRLMMKTFRREVDARFPTDEAGKEDPSGFLELIRTLEVLKRTYDDVRLEVASWTSTGIVRTGNEDAYAVLHAAESRQDDFGEAVLIILCDGMGGYEAGEVAAALTIQSLRKTLAALRPFSVAAGESPFLADPLAHTPRGEGHAAPPLNLDEVKAAIKAALREANRHVFQTSRAPGSKRRGMGCTAEVVYIDGRNVIVGHVGDSRTYHLHEGRLIQLTRDQTLVNRLVELGTLSAAEAETHPRRNELQQAIGGQPDVEPGLYAGTMSPGDWVVVCSDGLTNHVTSKDLQQMLQSEASSAETAARRLVNLTLIEGATDNVTVVVVRAT